MHVKKYLKKIGLEKEEYFFWKQVGKALLCTYAIMGAVWIYKETSPLGWWTFKPRPKEERELAEFPYPGHEEAMKEFIAKGGMTGTSTGPNGMLEYDKNSSNYQKELEGKKFDQEAQKLWLKMRDEVIAELKEKGFKDKWVQWMVMSLPLYMNWLCGKSSTYTIC